MSKFEKSVGPRKDNSSIIQIEDLKYFLFFSPLVENSHKIEKDSIKHYRKIVVSFKRF